MPRWISIQTHALRRRPELPPGAPHAISRLSSRISTRQSRPRRLPVEVRAASSTPSTVKVAPARPRAGRPCGRRTRSRPASARGSGAAAGRARCRRSSPRAPVSTTPSSRAARGGRPRRSTPGRGWSRAAASKNGEIRRRDRMSRPHRRRRFAVWRRGILPRVSVASRLGWWARITGRYETRRPVRRSPKGEGGCRVSTKRRRRAAQIAAGPAQRIDCGSTSIVQSTSSGHGNPSSRAFSGCTIWAVRGARSRIW